MLIDLKSTKVYIISPGVNKYRERLYTVFARIVDAGFRSVEYIKSLPGQNGTSSLTNTVLEIFHREMSGDDPFIILEDDCEVFHSYDSISIPDDSTMVYLGVSSWIYPHDKSTLYTPYRPHIQPHSISCVSSYDTALTRITGMTGTHAILYRSRTFMQEFIRTMKDITERAGIVPHDLVFATFQQQYPCYALKHPMFYQDKRLGGQEDITKLVYDTDRYHA